MAYSIGNVIVHSGYPPKNNPFRVYGLIFDERESALTRFKHGKDTSDVTFWYARMGDPAKQITDPNEINWSTSGIK